MNVVFKALFYKDNARVAIDSGVSRKNYCSPEHVYYENCLINLDQVESAAPNTDFKGHTTVSLNSGDSFVVKLETNDFFKLVDHIEADKLLCRFKN